MRINIQKIIFIQNNMNNKMKTKKLKNKNNNKIK